MSEGSWIKNDMTCVVKYKQFHISGHSVLPLHFHLYHVLCQTDGSNNLIKYIICYGCCPELAHTSIMISGRKAKASLCTQLS